MARKRQSQKSYLIIWVVFLGIIAGLALMRRQQFIASQALTPKATGNVEIKAQDTESGLKKVDVLVRTGVDPENTEAVSTVAFRLKVGGLGEMEAVDIDNSGIELAEVGGDFADEEKWEIPVNSIKKESDELVLDFSAVNLTTEGFSTPEYKTITSFYISGFNEGEEPSFNFDDELSVMYSKRRPVTDIWEQE